MGIDIFSDKSLKPCSVHTWSHRALTTLSTEQIVAELQHTILAIEQVIGTRPTYMRPPFGDIGICNPSASIDLHCR